MGKQMKIQENKAITLIALVITIIVLIILAGVAINLTLGQNGLFARAKQASENYRIAKEKEELQLEIADIQTQIIKEEGRVATLQDLYNKIDKIKFAIEISNDEIADIDSTIVNPTYAVVNKIESNIYFTVDKKLEIIKVEVKEKATQKAEIVKVSNTTWSNGKATVELTTKETGTIEYKVGEGGIYQPGTTISNLSNGDIVYARVNNNGTYTDEETKEIKDTILPEEFKIEVSDITTDSVKIAGSTQDNQTGLATYSYVAATKTNEIVKEITGQTVTEYTITGLSEETEYVVYMLAYDKAGNVRKSNEVEVTIPISPTEIYAKLYTDGTLSLASTNEKTLEGKTVKDRYRVSNYSSVIGKDQYRTLIKKVIILDKIRPSSSCNNWFFFASNLTSIENIENIDTRLVEDMTGMFSGCSAITNLDLSSFDTSKVTSMECMFYDCEALTNLNLSSFDTSKVTSMSSMFYDCGALTNLNLSSFNTSNVADMSCMFNNCKSLVSLDLSNFRTEKTNIRCMFMGCESLTSLDLGNINTSNTTDMSNLFWNCKSLTSLDLSNFDTSNVTNMMWMFMHCNALTNLNLSSFDTTNVTSMHWMFRGCNSITNLDLSSFNTKKVTDMTLMFYDCKLLTNIKVNRTMWQTASNNNGMFINCGTQELTYID